MAQVFLGKEDPKEVVIDDLLGQTLALYLIPLNAVNIVLIFILFRIFDIWKPFPIRSVEKEVGGGGGIVLDDLLASLYAVAAFHVIRAFL